MQKTKNKTMKKTDSTEIFHAVKSKLMAKGMNKFFADRTADEVRSHMFNNKRFIVKHGSMMYKSNGANGCLLTFKCEFLYPDTGEKRIARFVFRSEWTNYSLITNGKFLCDFKTPHQLKTCA